SSVHCQAVNDAQMAVSYVQALRRRVADLEDAVSHMNALNHSGAANDPLAALHALGQRVAPALPIEPLSPQPRGRGLSTRTDRRPKP
ncbi:MAG: hypothetical protein JSR38_13645, partial [Proteobacteria bacterium]|nr:hypothetical protein [Pseudomonadota bacterium]